MIVEKKIIRRRNKPKPVPAVGAKNVYITISKPGLPCWQACSCFGLLGIPWCSYTTLCMPSQMLLKVARTCKRPGAIEAAEGLLARVHSVVFFQMA
jgi:hypothetical protein